jgi:hypothetical protein
MKKTVKRKKEKKTNRTKKREKTDRTGQMGQPDRTGPLRREKRPAVPPNRTGPFRPANRPAPVVSYLVSERDTAATVARTLDGDGRIFAVRGLLDVRAPPI